MKRKISVFTLSILCTCCIDVAHAACIGGSIDKRLQSYCFLDKVEGEITTYQLLTVIDTVLEIEGFSSGIDGMRTVPWNNFGWTLGAVTYYEEDINGGTPQQKISLEELTFHPRNENAKVGGIVGGLSASISGRKVYGFGDYFDYGITTEVTYSPEYDLHMGSVSGSMCSRNYFQNAFYADICLSAQAFEKKLKKAHASSSNFLLFKIIKDVRNNYHKFGLGFDREYRHDFTQSHFKLVWETIYADNFSTDLSVSIGEKLDNHLVNKYSISGQVSTNIFGRNLSAFWRHYYDNGGSFFGYPRSDITNDWGINYQVTDNVSLSVGYLKINSSINYFDTETPKIALQYKLH